MGQELSEEELQRGRELTRLAEALRTECMNRKSGDN